MDVAGDLVTGIFGQEQRAGKGVPHRVGDGQ
jgi:hypothetical protein